MKNIKKKSCLHKLSVLLRENNNNKLIIYNINNIIIHSALHCTPQVLVDAAAFVPTNPLDLSKCPADFVTMSFYKIFGYPTGLGALLIRTEDVSLLHKLYWGGGSVALATSTDNFHVLRCKPSDRLEDGTVAFLDIIALQQASRGGRLTFAGERFVLYYVLLFFTTFETVTFGWFDVYMRKLLIDT